MAAGRNEDFLNRQPEQFGDSESKRQRWVIAAGFDRVDALSRHVEAPREIALAPIVAGAEDFDPVVHRLLVKPLIQLVNDALQFNFTTSNRGGRLRAASLTATGPGHVEDVQNCPARRFGA